MELIQQMEEDLFKAVLQRKRQVHIALSNFGVRAARLPNSFSIRSEK